MHENIFKYTCAYNINVIVYKDMSHFINKTSISSEFKLHFKDPLKRILFSFLYFSHVRYQEPIVKAKHRYRVVYTDTEQRTLQRSTILRHSAHGVLLMNKNSRAYWSMAREQPTWNIRECIYTLAVISVVFDSALRYPDRQRRFVCCTHQAGSSNSSSLFVGGRDSVMERNVCR